MCIPSYYRFLAAPAHAFDGLRDSGDEVRVLFKAHQLHGLKLAV